MLIHASAAALGSEAVLVRGPSGAGKSDLVLRLMTRGWQLVADDQVMIEGTQLAAPPALRGLLEIRGLGIFEALPAAPCARLCLVVDLVPQRVDQHQRRTVLLLKAKRIIQIMPFFHLLNRMCKPR